MMSYNEGDEAGMSAKTEQVKGRLKEAAGSLFNNARLRRRGKTEKLAGKAKEVVKDGTDEVEEAVDALKEKLPRV